MVEEKIVVPDGMLKAANAVIENYDGKIGIAYCEEFRIKLIIEAALLYLSENPIVPSDKQVAEMRDKLVPVHPHWANIVCEWQRRMFLAPKLEVPEEIKDLVLDNNLPIPAGIDARYFTTVVIEAYRRGQKFK